MLLVTSCNENHVEPWAYLQSVIQALSSDPGLEDFFPDRWLEENPASCGGNDDQCKQEREVKDETHLSLCLLNWAGFGASPVLRIHTDHRGRRWESDGC